MSELDHAAAEILTKSQAALASFSDNIASLAKQYGPDVANAALEMARVDAAQHLVWGFGGLGVTIFLSWVYFKKTRNWIVEAFDRTPGPFFFCLFGIFAAILAVATTVANLLDLWVWFGVFEPKLWLAKRILGL